MNIKKRRFVYEKIITRIGEANHLEVEALFICT